MAVEQLKCDVACATSVFFVDSIPVTKVQVVWLNQGWNY